MGSLATSMGDGIAKTYMSEILYAKACVNKWNVPSMIKIHKSYENIRQRTLCDMQ